MNDNNDLKTETVAPLWVWTKRVCLSVVVLGVLSCVLIAVVRSLGVTSVTVTALSQEQEPKDHDIPFFKQKDALPDYQITVNTTDYARIQLGAKPNQSAIGGLTWELPDPVSTCDVASIRLDDQDKFLSDAIVEVQYSDGPITKGNYRFEFSTARSFNVGLRSYFKTPVGLAISAAFTLVVLLVLFSLLGGFIGY